MGNSPQPQLPFDTDSAAPLPASASAALRVATVDRAPMLLTVRDVEAELQLGRTRTYELIRSGELPVVRLGRVVRVPRDALQRWIEDRSASAPPEDR